MSGEGRPVMRIPSIFDSDDDSDDESRSPVSYRGITTTTTTTTTTTAAAKPIVESQTEAPQPAHQPPSLSSNSESDAESLSPKPEEAKGGKDTAGSPHVQSSSEGSEDSGDGSGGKDVFSSREKLEDDEDVTLMANEEDDVNISHSSPENQEESEDEEDDSSISDDDEDESDDDQDQSGSSLEDEGAEVSEDRSSRVVYSPTMPLSIKITTGKKGQFTIKQDTTPKSPFPPETKNEKQESKPEEKEVPVEVEERKDDLVPGEKDEEKMELGETSKVEEIDVDEDKIEAIEEKEERETRESSKNNTPAREENEDSNESEERVCKTLSSEEKEEEEGEEEDTLKTDKETDVLSKPEESKEDKPLEDIEAKDKESTKGEEALLSQNKDIEALNKTESEPMETTVKEDDRAKPETTEAPSESDESDTDALKIELPKAKGEEQGEKKELKVKEEEEEEEEPMEVDEEEDDTVKEIMAESDGDNREIEEIVKVEEKEEEVSQECITGEEKEEEAEKKKEKDEEEKKKEYDGEEKKEDQTEEEEEQVVIKEEEKGEIPETEGKVEENMKDDDDVKMKECKVEEVEDEEEVDRDLKFEESSPPPPSPPPPSPPPPPPSPPPRVVLDSDTDSEASLDAQKAQAIMKAAASKKRKVPLRVEDVYMDSDDSQGPTKTRERGNDNDGDDGSGGGGGRQSAMTSETDSVDPEDQRDYFSQHSSSRASSTDLFSKASSPRPESPCDVPSAHHTPHIKRSHVLSPAELTNYLEAFKRGWQREIVLRATHNPTKAGPARADIYYYTPSGKKLRSRVEIEDYLCRMGIKDLTLKNFTWMKEPLGVSEEYEQIRNASNKSVASSVGAAPRRKPSQGTPNSSRNTSPSSTPASSVSSLTTQTPKTSPVITITSYTKVSPPKTPPKAPTISPPASSATGSSSAAPRPVGVGGVSPGSAASPAMTQMYDESGAPKRKRGRGRPRKYPEGTRPPKRPRVKTSPAVSQMKSPGPGGVGPVPPPPPPPPPPPLPPPPTSIPAHQVPTGLHHLKLQPPPQVLSLGPQRPILLTPTPRPRQTRKTKDPIVTTSRVTRLPPCPPKILTPMLMGGARQRSFHCTGTCPLGGGSVPCLQCLKCLCLFHPECTCMPPPTVHIIQAGAAKFLCPNCYWENKENVGSTKWVPPEPFEPLAHDPTSSSSSDTEEEEAGTEEKVWVGDYVRVCVRPNTPPTPPSSPSPSHSLGPWRTDGSDSRQEMTGDPTQLGDAGEAARSMTPVGGILPGGAGLGGQLVQIQQQGAGPACFLLVQGGPGAPGGELVPMPGGVGAPVGPLTHMGMSRGMSPFMMPRLPMQQQQQQLQMGAPIMMAQQAFQPSATPLNVPPQAPFPQKQDVPKGKHYKQYYQALSPWDNTFLGELSQRYLLLRHVFKFLSVRDLLVASQVCLLWRDLAFSSSLWETVRLRNVCVKDWMEFARFLERRNTKNIDLRKMKKSMQSRKEQKVVKGGRTTLQATPKLSDKPGTSRTEGKNGKKTKEDTEEALSAESSQDQPESSRSIEEENRNGHRKEGQEGREAGDGRGVKRKRSTEDEDSYMECREEEEEEVDHRRSREPAGKLEAEEEEWQEIFTALSNVRCLRGMTLPSCPGRVLQLLLASCRHITSINAMDLRHSSGCVRFDPTYLMEAPDLVELRVGSASGFSLTTNFNFIKLQRLKVLVMRGLAGDSWPYLGTNLTTLQVGPVRTFTTSTWANLGNMTNLQALWLEEGGSLSDTNIHEGLSRLTSLRRLCLFNFVVGPKIGHALKKLLRLERLFILPVGTEEASIRNQNGNMLVLLEMLRNVEELVWGVHASDVCVSAGTDCIQMCPTKTKVFSGMMDTPEGNLWSLPQLEMSLKRHLPHSNVRIIKLDPTAASHLALAIL